MSAKEVSLLLICSGFQPVTLGWLFLQAITLVSLLSIRLFHIKIKPGYLMSEHKMRQKISIRKKNSAFVW